MQRTVTPPSPPTSVEEGVIKYALSFHEGPPPAPSLTAPLRAWHRIAFSLGLLGQDDTRYGGAAYGNLSRRIEGARFVVSGSQTGGRPATSAEDYATVDQWQLRPPSVAAHGPLRPSSETLTHAAIYAAAPAAQCVMHGHSPAIWNAKHLQLPTTDPLAAYGTPEMAESVRSLIAQGQLGSEGAFVMGGHEDGVVAYGSSVEQAGQMLVALLARALR